MKKMMIVVAVVAMSFAACGKKKDAAKPTDMGSAAAPAGSDAAGSGAADGSAAPAPGM